LENGLFNGYFNNTKGPRDPICTPNVVYTPITSITLSHEQRASRHAVIENKDDEHQMSPADSFRC